MTELGDMTGLEDMVGIDPITGEFDINLVPENIRPDVEAMAKAMIDEQSIRGPKLKGCHRKKKKKIRKPKTFGQNKNKKKRKK
jgi:hypothetical protein